MTFFGLINDFLRKIKIIQYVSNTTRWVKNIGNKLKSFKAKEKLSDNSYVSNKFDCLSHKYKTN